MRNCVLSDIYRAPGDTRLPVLPPHVRRDLIRIAERCGVERLILFGSRAKGYASATSDIDLALEGGDAEAFEEAAEAEVRSLLILDLTPLDYAVSSSFAQEIHSTGMVLYDRRHYMRKLDNFQGSLAVLRSADLTTPIEDPIYRMGVLGQFRLTFELAWKALQQIMRDDGVDGSEQGSPRELLQLAAMTGYLPAKWDDRTWRAMLKWRNVSTHEYDEESADELAILIQTQFLPALEQLSETLERKLQEDR